MAKAVSRVGIGQGWHKQSVGHSIARSKGKWANAKIHNQTSKRLSINIKNNDVIPKQKYKQIPIYSFEEASPELKQKILENYSNINVDYDWWEMDGLFDPTEEDFKRLGKDFQKQYDEDTKKGYSSLNNFKIESFDLAREGYLQIKDIDTKNQNTFLKQIGLTKEEAKKVYRADVLNERENDSQVILNFNEELPEAEQDKIQEKASTGFTSLIQNAKKQLREDYDYRTSDEEIIETLKANDYTFNTQGKIE